MRLLEESTKVVELLAVPIKRPIGLRNHDIANKTVHTVIRRGRGIILHLNLNRLPPALVNKINLRHRGQLRIEEKHLISDSKLANGSAISIKFRNFLETVPLVAL